MDKKRRVPSNDIVTILQILSTFDMILFLVRLSKLYICLLYTSDAADDP